MKLGRMPLLLLPFVSCNLLANGINPPRPAGGVVLRAECITKTGDPGMEIYRARLKSGSVSQDALEVRAGNGIGEVPLSDWSSLRGLDRRRDKAGFVQVLGKKGDATQPSKTAIRVHKDGSDIELIGFSKAGQRIGVPLSKCSEVLVSTVSATETGQGSGARRD
jgi:hypothetical protein